MYTMILGAAWGLMGLTDGWTVSPSGGITYIVQIEPGELEMFKRDGIVSDIRPELRDIRTLNIIVGTAKLPHDKLPPAAASPAAEKLAPPTPSPGPPRGDASKTSPPSISKRFPFSGAASELGKSTSDTTPGGSSKLEPESKTRSNEAATERKTSPQKTEDRGTPSRQGTEKRSDTHEQTKSLAGKEVPKPWGALTAALVALCGSMAGNVYLGWITWETRKRYRNLLRRRKKVECDDERQELELDH